MKISIVGFLSLHPNFLNDSHVLSNSDRTRRVVPRIFMFSVIVIMAFILIEKFLESEYNSIL